MQLCRPQQVTTIQCIYYAQSRIDAGWYYANDHLITIRFFPHFLSLGL